MSDLSSIAHASPDARVIGPEDLVDTAERVLAPDPSQILFATPESTHITLPTGLLWDGALIQDVEVRELTGADEEMLARESKTREFMGPAQFVDTILRGTVIAIGDDRDHKSIQTKLRQMLIGDRWYIALAIRRLTYGDEWEIEQFVCRLCGKSFGVAVDLRCPEGGDIKLRTLENPMIQTVEVPLRRGTATVRLVNGGDELMALGDAGRTIPEQTSIYLDQCTQRVNGVHTPIGFSQRLGMADRHAIVDALVANAPGPMLGEVSVPCSECGRSADYSLSMADLFLS